MIKSASDYTLFERNVYSKHEPADSRFLKSLKRKLQKITDENKENIVIAPKRKILDFDEIHSKKENFRKTENLLHNCVNLEKKYLSVQKPNESNQILLNMHCYSDPSYDLQLNNLVENRIDSSPIKEISHNNYPNTLKMKLDESLENIFSISYEVRPTDQIDQNIIVPFELYYADELEKLNKEQLIKEKKSAPKRKLSNTDIDPEQNNPEVTKLSSLAKKLKFDEHIPEAPELNFGMKLIPKLFTVDEIKTGIFGNRNNNSSSKTQTPFDLDKVDDFKNQIAKKFNYSEIKMEAAWEYLRTSFNKKLREMRKKLNKK